MGANLIQNKKWLVMQAKQKNSVNHNSGFAYLNVQIRTVQIIGEDN